MDKQLEEITSLEKEKAKLNIYEYIWSKVFPNEELNYDDFYDWARENSSKALDLCFEYFELNNK